MKANECQSSYLKNVFVTEYRRLIIKYLIDNIHNSKIEFDSIVFRGMSGALLVPEISSLINKPMILVRKDDDSHSSHKVEGYAYPKNFIIIDDLIYSGATVRHVIDEMEERFPSPKCVGIFLYHSEDDSPSTFQVRTGTPQIPVYSFIVKTPPEMPPQPTI